MTDDATREAARRLREMSKKLRQLAVAADELSRLLSAHAAAVKATTARGRPGKQPRESFAAATRRILDEYDKLEREFAVAGGE